MSEILLQLGILTITMICNILCGVYYNKKKKKIRFDKYKLLNEMIKTFIVGIYDKIFEKKYKTKNARLKYYSNKCQ